MSVDVVVDGGGAAVFVVVSIGGEDGRGSTRGRGRDADELMEPLLVVGSEPAIVPGGAVDVVDVVAVPGRVKAVVVSTFVVVMGVVTVGAVSVGAVNVAAPLVEPS